MKSFRKILEINQNNGNGQKGERYTIKLEGDDLEQIKEFENQDNNNSGRKFKAADRSLLTL